MVDSNESACNIYRIDLNICIHKGNMSDIDHSVNHEAEGPFECVYVKPRRICVVVKCISYRTQCIHIIS